MGSMGGDKQAMLNRLGFKKLDDLIDSTVPKSIRLARPLALDAPMSESDALHKLKSIMSKNKVLKSFIGMGYYETLTPTVILRNMLENPGWYTAYTPYQAEISQGRLESLLNFQTMVADMTGMNLSNASLLDEATAAAEAMSMCYTIRNQKKNKFFVDEVFFLSALLVFYHIRSAVILRTSLLCKLGELHLVSKLSLDLLYLQTSLPMIFVVR